MSLGFPDLRPRERGLAEPSRLTWPAIAALCLLAVGNVGASDDASRLAFERDIRPILTEFCYDCHGDKRQKGEINLAKYRNVGDIMLAAGQWDDVLRVINEGEMPPKKEKQPSAEQREKLARFIDHTLDSIGTSGAPADPGHVLFHRLNRAEYNNTMRDLLGVDTRPADKFPADGGGGAGFDNNADTLFTPPLLLEKMLEAAGEAIDAAKPEHLAIAKPADDKPKSAREAARTTLTGFMPRAYRRPVYGPEVERLLKIYDKLAKRGIDHEDAVRHVLKAVLVSPNFLFRVEAQKASPQPYEIGQHEMACRLSYFLWSSMPDDELMKLADEKRLHDPAVIEQQVLRMLKDPKARALGENFASQWLQTDSLKTGSGPDAKRFPQYTPALRDAMCEEPVAFFNALLREDRSLLHLIDADYAWINESLAGLYGISGVRGEELRQVKITDPNRGGVLGMAGVLAVTSHPLRTSPVLRGKWVLEQLLNAPPPPPPPNTPTLPQDETPKEEASLRKRLEAHRADAVCASCHSRIDPLGFGLENFDPMGVWRTKDIRGEALDTSGVLASGEQFSGPAELKKLLLARKDKFARAMTEKLLAYALGRGLGVHDRQTIKAITARVIAKDYSTVTLAVEIAKSQPFRFKRNQPIPIAPPASAQEKSK